MTDYTIATNDGTVIAQVTHSDVTDKAPAKRFYEVKIPLTFYVEASSPEMALLNAYSVARANYGEQLAEDLNYDDGAEVKLAD